MSSISIDQQIAARKQAAARQRQLDEMTRHLTCETTTSVEIHDTSCWMLQHVADLLPRCHKLQKLYFLQGVSCEGALALQQALPKASALKTLKILHHTSEIDQAEEALCAILEGIAHCGDTALTELVLSDCVMQEPETFTALVHAVWKGNLTHLSLVDMPHNSILKSKDICLGRLIQPGLKKEGALDNNNINTTSTATNQLTNLQIIRCGITMDGSESLGKGLLLPPRPHNNICNNNSAVIMQDLNLEGNPLGDNGCMMFALHLMKCNNPNLKRLRLSSCQIENYGAKVLAETLRGKNNTMLQELNLSGNPGILIEGKEALVESLKQNVSLVSTGMRVTRRHPIQPTVVEQMGDLLDINATRHRWNGTLLPGLMVSAAHNAATNMTVSATSTIHDATATDYRTGSMMPYYLGKVSPKPCVLFLALRENVHLLTPYLPRRHNHN